MMTELNVNEYLDEIRKQVCSCCIERPPGGPPCAPLGKQCGVELHLPELIASIHEMDSPLIEPYLDHNRCEICQKCAYLDSSICPCPMDYLAVPIVRAVDTVDQRRQRLGLGRRDISSLPCSDEADLGAIAGAYEEALGRWMGCDWPTKFGASGLDLNGWTAAKAAVVADERVSAKQKEDWRAAAAFLTRIERQAAQAEAHATLALVAAQSGEWPDAVKHSRRAYALEFASGRPLGRHGPLTWGPFYNAIWTVAANRGPVSGCA
jgi:hypothetical protein